MAVVRVLIVVLLLASAVCFGVFAFTGNVRYKRLGLAVFKWTLVAALGFFAVLFLDRWFG